MLILMTDRPLDAMICFSLYSASQAVMQAYRSVLAPWRLTYPQFLVLRLLAGSDDLSVGRIGEQMNLDSGTVSPLVRRLESRGLVRRKRDAADDRVVRVALTAEGRRIASEVADAVGCLSPAYRVDAASVPDVLATLHGISAGMGELTDSIR